MTAAMLRPTRIEEAISTYRMPATANGPLPDAEEAVDRLRRWRFACDPPLHRYKATFRGNVGEIRELHLPAVEPCTPPASRRRASR